MGKQQATYAVPYYSNTSGIIAADGDSSAVGAAINLQEHSIHIPNELSADPGYFSLLTSIALYVMSLYMD